MLTQERKDQLEAAYQANVAAGRAPYTNVLINNLEEMRWIFAQRNWSGQFWLESGQSRADLTGADLTGARLTDADLTGADLTRADLTGADLTDADLTGADLTDARLTRARLTAIKADIFDVVDQSPLDLPYMIQALRDGKVDGSCYHSDCDQGCLVGTLEISAAKRLNTTILDSAISLAKNSNRPAERWFLAILPGMTPENSPIVAWTVRILEERLAFYDRIAAIWPKAVPTSEAQP